MLFLQEKNSGVGTNFLHSATGGTGAQGVLRTLDTPGWTPNEGAAMRKVILMMQVSLDGFIEGPGQDLGCHRVDDELHRHFIDELRSMGAFLDGRVTYQMMADYWPTADQNPSSTPMEADFGRGLPAARPDRGVPDLCASSA